MMLMDKNLKGLEMFSFGGFDFLFYLLCDGCKTNKCNISLIFLQKGAIAVNMTL